MYVQKHENNQFDQTFEQRNQSNMWVIQTTIWPPRQREKLTTLHTNEKRQGQQYAYGDTDRSRGKIF